MGIWIIRFKCKKCGYEWMEITNGDTDPYFCPACQSEDFTIDEKVKLDPNKIPAKV